MARQTQSCAGAGAVLMSALLACSVASPATEIRDALAAQAPLEVRAGGVRMTLRRAQFKDLEVSALGARAQVLAVVDADGVVSLEGGEVSLGYVGREAFEMVRCARARWCAPESPVPALARVVGALAALPREGGRRPLAWQIRVERGRAAVGEDAVGPGGTFAQRRRFELVEVDGRWRPAPPP